MPEQPIASGADLARQALNAYRIGRIPGQIPGTARKPERRSRTDRTGGRDPQGLANVISRLATEQGWNQAVDGGSILDQWAALCPQYDGKVQPVAYDPERGRLDLRPGSPAYAAQLRLLGGQLCKQINDKVGRTVVRSIRVLPVATLTPAPAPPPPNPRPATPAGPVHTREHASPGYHLALAEHHAHKPERTRLLTPAVTAAIATSDQALADPANREPAAAFTDARAEHERLEHEARPKLPSGKTVRDSLEASIAAAILAKHHGNGPEPRRLFQAS